MHQPPVMPLTGGPPGPPTVRPLDLSRAEVKHLWSFLDGEIMDLHVRQHLRRSWGFCPRHLLRCRGCVAGLVERGKELLHHMRCGRGASRPALGRADPRRGEGTSASVR
ncbi:MAG TPA: hypothetical protein VJ010_04950 [Actinomycetota bacterium]|nr:hypothetical protein [Actinomycetota bacterium]